MKPLCIIFSQVAFIYCGLYRTSEVLADSHRILNRWKNHFCQLLNVPGANGVWQSAVPTAVPMVREPSGFDVQMAIENLGSVIKD